MAASEKTLLEAKPQTLSRELRRLWRNKLPVPVRLRPEDVRIGEEITTARNSSRNGLYFTTRRNVYYPGMRLRLAFPYYASSSGIHPECTAHVVRVERLSDSEWGVALKVIFR
jgi:hypothetical protein